MILPAIGITVTRGTAVCKPIIPGKKDMATIETPKPVILWAQAASKITLLTNKYSSNKCLYLRTRTGQADNLTTLSVTDPSKKRLIPLRPWEGKTIKSADISWA